MISASKILREGFFIGAWDIKEYYVLTKHLKDRTTYFIYVLNLNNNNTSRRRPRRINKKEFIKLYKSEWFDKRAVNKYASFKIHLNNMQERYS